MGLLGGDFGVTLGQLLAYEGNFGGISGSLWGYFEHIDVEFHVWCMCHAYMYGLGGAENGKSQKTRLVFKAFLKGSRYPRGDSENEQLTEPSHFRVTLGPLWCHFGYIRVTLGHFMITLGSLWSYFGCNKVGFQKTLIFPIDFNDFIQL